MKKKIFILFIILIAILSFSSISFAVTDESEYRSYYENIIVQHSGYTSSQFSDDTSKTYFIFYEESTGLYHMIANHLWGGFGIGNSWYAKSTSDWSLYARGYSPRYS